ncbi:MAG: oxygenase MpaB family protein [Caulobacter sp.]
MAIALRDRLAAAARDYIQPTGVPAFDFGAPAGEPALAAPDSVSWRVFANPVALFIGGVTAVLLELAEPRVRSGVWDHTSFRTDPLPRMKRTGLAAMITVYGARGKAEAMIAGIGRMHGRVSGVTPAGAAYRADDPELLDWVQATASYGFMEAYHRFVRPLTNAERDGFYAESAPAARLYGATGAPTSVAELEACFQAMRPKLERSEIVFEFLDIMRRTAILPGPLRAAQGLFIRAGVELLPPWTRETLGLGKPWGLRPWEARLVRAAGAMAERMVLPSSPREEARRRLGLAA